MNETMANALQRMATMFRSEAASAAASDLASDAFRQCAEEVDELAARLRGEAAHAVWQTPDGFTSASYLACTERVDDIKKVTRVEVQGEQQAVAFGVPDGHGGIKFGKGAAFTATKSESLGTTFHLYGRPQLVAVAGDGLLGIVRTAMAQAGRVIRREGDADDLAQEKRELPGTLRVIEHALTAALAQDRASQVAASGVPEGWRLVPEKPTEAMLDRGWEYGERIDNCYDREGSYADLIAAAPTPAAED